MSAWLAWLLAVLLVQPVAAADESFERAPLAVFQSDSVQPAIAPDRHEATLEQDDRLADERDGAGDPGPLPASPILTSSSLHGTQPSALACARALAPGCAYRARAPPAM